MPSTFDTADVLTTEVFSRAVNDYHPLTREAGVTFGVLLASNPDGPAVKSNGYAVSGTCKPVSAKDRVSKNYDAEIVLDRSDWEGMNDEQQLALADHLLSQLTPAPLSDEELKDARAEDPKAPWWKTDDRGRPKLKKLLGDIPPLAGFKACVTRHQLDSVEYRHTRMAKAMIDVALKEAEEGQEK